jgi:hypothetical protein
MSVKQSVVVLSILWFIGCASPDPKQPSLIQEQAQEQQLEQELELALRQERALDLAFQQQDRTLTGPQMLTALAHVSNLKDKAAKQRVKELQARSAKLSADERFELALLLSRKGADEKLQNQAMKLFKHLETEVKEAAVLEILQRQQRYLALEKQYRKARKKNLGLEKKIEHLKGLERELEETNMHMGKSLGPNQERTN